MRQVAMKWFLWAIASVCWLVPSTDAIARVSSVPDSIRRVQDSLTMQFIGSPDPGRPNQFADSLRKVVVVQNGDFLTWLSFTKSLQQSVQADPKKSARERWVIGAIGLLLVLLGIVRVSFPSQVLSIIQAFYNDRMLLQINKEDTLYSSWPFIFLYILFGFAVGLFVYVCNGYYWEGGYRAGVNTFLGISVFVMLLFVLKIIVTRFLGRVFDVQRIVREYVSILYLSYFNAALVFLPVVLILSLVPHSQMVWIIPVTLIVVLGLFIFRFIKTASSILRNHRFSKFYLFMYLCCLEIAPILILVKVLSN